MGIIPSYSRRFKMLYRVLIVRPLCEFQPVTWRQRPKSYEVVHVLVTDTPFLGKADGARFLFNKDLIESGSGFDTWAITESMKVPTLKTCGCGGVLVDMSTPDMMSIKKAR